jgi:pimeloyl-ACP methyl ester carboxylesterase
MSGELDWDEGMRRVRTFPFDPNGPFVSVGAPAPDGFAMVGWDQNCLFPAYRVADANGDLELVPFTPMAQFAPEGYHGDYFVDHFTDAAIKKRWLVARDDPQVRARIMAQVGNLQIPHEFRGTGSIDPRGKIDPHGEVDLRAIRRPSFFGAAPWSEEIAQVDSFTSIVEVEVPREPYEKIHMDRHEPLRLRGWHIAGAGVPNRSGKRIKAIAVLISGRNIETTGIHHPDDAPCFWSAEHKAWLQLSYPRIGGKTESGGARPWREHVLAFFRAGFDVLTLDKRGHGISGGASDTNCNEQGEDVFRTLDALESGRGARVLTPDGRLLMGEDAAGCLLGGQGARDIPVVLGGASQGSMATCWAMHKNFVGSCDFDRPNPVERGPYGYSIRAALLLAPFGGGLGYRSSDDSLVEAARRNEFNVQMFTSGEILGGVSRWPAIFVGRGLWDFSESLEGSLDCIHRVAGPRMLVAVRGPHGEGEWGPDNLRHMQDRMTAFAANALFGRSIAGYSPPSNIRDLVASAPPHWIETARMLP